jgi:hypothetical protein
MQMMMKVMRTKKLILMHNSLLMNSMRSST